MRDLLLAPLEERALRRPAREPMGEAAHTEGWLDEVRSAYLYRVIAEVERGSPRSTLFLELAREADGQAAIWAKNAGLAPVPALFPDLRSRVVPRLVACARARAM